MTKLSTIMCGPLGPGEQLYVRSMGKLLRVTAVFGSDDDANAYMAKHQDDAVLACIGPFILLANRFDRGCKLAED